MRIGTTDDTSTEATEAGTTHLKRFEKRGASAHNGVERAVTRNRRHLEREVQQVRKNLDRRSGLVSARVGGITARVEELVSNAQGLMS